MQGQAGPSWDGDGDAAAERCDHCKPSAFLTRVSHWCQCHKLCISPRCPHHIVPISSHRALCLGTPSAFLDLFTPLALRVGSSFNFGLTPGALHKLIFMDKTPQSQLGFYHWLISLDQSRFCEIKLQNASTNTPLSAHLHSSIQTAVRDNQSQPQLPLLCHLKDFIPFWCDVSRAFCEGEQENPLQKGEWKFKKEYADVWKIPEENKEAGAGFCIEGKISHTQRWSVFCQDTEWDVCSVLFRSKREQMHCKPVCISCFITFSFPVNNYIWRMKKKTKKQKSHLDIWNQSPLALCVCLCWGKGSALVTPPNPLQRGVSRRGVFSSAQIPTCCQHTRGEIWKCCCLCALFVSHYQGCVARQPW